MWVSKILKYFSIIIFSISIIVVIIDPFSLLFVGIINLILISIYILNYIIYKLFGYHSKLLEIILITLGFLLVLLLFQLRNNHNEINLSSDNYNREFIIVFNLDTENCIEYKSKITIPKSEILFICNDIEVYDDVSDVLIDGKINDSIYLITEVHYSEKFKKNIGIVYTGQKYENIIRDKDLFINIDAYIEKYILMN